jgi:class 3 adenylate cyclase
VLDAIARRGYDRMGGRAKAVFIATQVPASVVVALGVVGVLSAFYRPSAGEIAILAVSASLFTAVGVLFSIMRQRAGLDEIARWSTDPDPTPEETVAAWEAATSFPMRSFRRDSLTTNAIATIPSVIVIWLVLDLSVTALPVLMGTAVVAAAYGTIVTYAIAEFLVRPAVEDIAARLPDDYHAVATGLVVRKRLGITLVVFTCTAGLVVAALVTDGGGTRMLAISLAVAIGVAIALSLELSVLLSGSITGPLADLRRAFALVSTGDYDARVRVVSSDDIGELSNAFNHMARGLAEREQMREAFSTYLDKDIVPFILSGNFPEDGVELDVTVMFCDAHSFTQFAEQSTPREVVAALNALFERIVPVISRHGGHVDKFLGDGVLAVFGAPEGYADHADRALAAALEIVAAVNRPGDGLRVGVGLNSGPVVAGSIGGAGRLNFSVVGDTVNVAARVEEATRDLRDEVLVTASVRDALQGPAPVELRSRGTIPLKGKREAVELFAAPAGAQAASAASTRSSSTGSAAG